MADDPERDELTRPRRETREVREAKEILVKRARATALVAFGVGGRDGLDATASDVLSKGLIAAALKTLAFE